jgi:hypothetical protein
MRAAVQQAPKATEAIAADQRQTGCNQWSAYSIDHSLRLPGMRSGLAYKYLRRSCQAAKKVILKWQCRRQNTD